MLTLVKDYVGIMTNVTFGLMVLGGIYMQENVG